MHICINNLGHYWFRKWLVAWSAPSHYLNQCWNIVNWNFGNKLQWNFNQNFNIFIQENAFENVICEMSAILSRPHVLTLVSRSQWVHPSCGCIVTGHQQVQGSTHSSWKKRLPFSHLTFSNPFSWMKIMIFWFKFLFFFHYLNQCWLISNWLSVLWHSPESNSTRSAYELNTQHVFRIKLPKITTSSRGHWLKAHPGPVLLSKWRPLLEPILWALRPHF